MKPIKLAAWQQTLLAATLLVSAASCQVDATATAPVVPPDPNAQPDPSLWNTDVVLDAPAELPQAFSTIRSIGDMGFYYSAADGEMRLTAFDIASSQSLYQLPAHPLGRIRGVDQGVLVDEEQGLLFVTGLEGSGEDAVLTAHDAATGAEIWRTPLDYYSAQPIECGAAICVRSFSEQLVLAKASGAIIESFSVNDRRILLDRPDVWVTTISSPLRGTFRGLAASAPGSQDELWRLLVDDIEAITGAEVDPGFGWRIDFDEDNDAAIVYLADANGGGWVTFGISMTTGEALWGRTDLDPCLDSTFDDRPAVACVVDDDYSATTLVRINAATGATLWDQTVTTTYAAPFFDGSAIVVWQVDGESPDSYLRVDPTSGVAATASDPVPCLLGRGSHDFAYPDGELLWFAGGTQFTLCASDGSLLADSVVVAEATQLSLEGHQLWLTSIDGRPLAATN